MLVDHWRAIDKDIVKRPFITVGFAAFVLLVPLAATSVNRIIRAMGAKRWQRLHRAVYAIACLAILHFWWMKAGKHDFEKPIIYGSIVGLLLLYRIVAKLRSASVVPVEAQKKSRATPVSPTSRAGA